MKKFLAVLALLLICGNVFAASGTANAVSDRTLESYVDTGASKSIEITLSGTPGTATTVTLPDTAKGIKLYPQSNDIRFAVSQTVVAKATHDSTAVAVADLVVGAIAKANQWETRLLPSTTTRTMTILSATASVVVELEVF